MQKITTALYLMNIQAYTDGVLMCEQAPYEIERRRQDSEMERLQSLPEWKRNLIVKKRTGDAV